MTDESKAKWAAAGLFLAGFVYLYAASLHRFTTALHYAWLGGYEIINGRMPYRDFSFLTGPALIFIQALFFKVLGVSYAVGYVSHAALLNGLACAMICLLVWKRTKRLDWAAAAGAIPIVWYYAVFMAVPWYDHEAHFFILAALFILHFKPAASGRFAAGLLAATAFYCKQSHGAFGLVYLCLYLFVSQGWRAAAAFTVGGTAGVFAWTGAMASLGGWQPFYYDFFYLPLHSGRVGFTHEPRFFLIGVPLALGLLAAPKLKPYRVFAVPLAFSIAALALQSWLYLVFLLPLLLWPWLETVEERALVLALMLVQLDGRLTSNNEIKVYQPFLGVFFSLFCLAVSRMRLGEWARLALRWQWTLWLFLMAWGARLSYLHKINNPFPGTTVIFSMLGLALAYWLAREKKPAVMLPASVMLLASSGLLLRGVRTYQARLADPVFMAAYESSKPSRSIDEPMLRGVTMTEPDARGLEAALPALRALPPERKPFYTYCECDILYSLTGQALPPFWWFDPTATFKPGDATEDKIISFLEKDKYGTFVWCPIYDRLMQMPKLGDWLETNGTFEKDYNGYRFYALRAKRRS